MHVQGDGWLVKIEFSVFFTLGVGVVIKVDRLALEKVHVARRHLVEVAHAATVFQALSTPEINKSDLRPFSDFFNSLTGDLLEL